MYGCIYKVHMTDLTALILRRSLSMKAEKEAGERRERKRNIKEKGIKKEKKKKGKYSQGKGRLFGFGGLGKGI